MVDGSLVWKLGMHNVIYYTWIAG